MTRIKICGLTRPEDAALAAGLGAWALGVIFASESPRSVDMIHAAGLLKAGRAASNAGPEMESVGVFVNTEIAEIEKAINVCGLTAVQLHGEENAAFCAEVRSRTGIKVIKAVRVSDRESAASVVQFDTDLVLLDTYHPDRRGGTGTAFDWELAAGIPANIRETRLVLSGGISPENVAAALRELTPYALDVSSGVESAPGIKDPEKMKKLFAAVLHIAPKE